jgi:hypothetical protein
VVTDRKKKPASTSAGTGGGSSHFSRKEVLSFLETMEEILPFGDPEWQTVVTLHNNKFRQNRTKEALQRKFNHLQSAKMPTHS